MTPKHIIILGVAHPYRGGIAAFNERLAHQFQAEGHRVEIVTFTLQYPSFLFPGKTQYSDSPAPADLHIERRLNSVNPFNWITLGRELSRRRPDMLFVPYWMPFMAPCLGTVAHFVRSNGHTQVISLIHNLIPHERRIIDRQFSTYFMKNIDAAVALSRSVVEDVAQFPVSVPCSFSPHPLYDHYGALVDRAEACAHLGLDPSCRYVLFFGLIRDYKGLDLLLTAFADERLRDPNLRLVIAGEFYGRGEHYIELARQKGVYDRIDWHTHFIANEEVRYYFSLADLVAQPYKHATQSGVTQVAYHFERPMLVTDVGGLAEIVPHGKVGVVAAPDAQAIADGLVAFFDTQASVDYLEGIREEKKKYAWDAMSSTILQHLK